MVGDGAGADAGLLVELAAHRVLQRLARLHEAGEAGKHPRREAVLAAEHAAVAVDRQHDDDRIGAREMLGAAGRAVAPVAALGRPGRLAAAGAEAVALVPGDQAARLGERSEVVLGEPSLHRQRTQVADPERRRLVVHGDPDPGRQPRRAGVEAQQHGAVQIGLERQRGVPVVQGHGRLRGPGQHGVIVAEEIEAGVGAPADVGGRQARPRLGDAIEAVAGESRPVGSVDRGKVRKRRSTHLTHTGLTNAARAPGAAARQ